MVQNYIEKPNTIILAVGQASVDLANTKSLNMAEAVDKDGERTIGVITQLDTIEKLDKDMIGSLDGTLKTLKHGFVGLKNRTED